MRWFSGRVWVCGERGARQGTPGRRLLDQLAQSKRCIAQSNRTENGWHACGKVPTA